MNSRAKLIISSRRLFSILKRNEYKQTEAKPVTEQTNFVK